MRLKVAVLCLRNHVRSTNFIRSLTILGQFHKLSHSGIRFEGTFLLYILIDQSFWFQFQRTFLSSPNMAGAYFWLIIVYFILRNWYFCPFCSAIVIIPSFSLSFFILHLLFISQLNFAPVLTVDQWQNRVGLGQNRVDL